jgi:hypothetical protein
VIHVRNGSQTSNGFTTLLMTTSDKACERDLTSIA